MVFQKSVLGVSTDAKMPRITTTKKGPLELTLVKSLLVTFRKPARNGFRKKLKVKERR